MTLIIAFKCYGPEGTEAIHITADRKASGDIIVDVDKIIPIAYLGDKQNDDNAKEIDLALVSGAGHPGLIRQFARIVEDIFLKAFTNTWSNKEPSFHQFEQATLIVQDEYMNRLNMIRRNGSNAMAHLLLCGLDRTGKVSMYEFDYDGIAIAVHDSPGFACLGRGFLTGGDIIMKLLWNPEINADWSLYLSAFTLNMVTLVDPSVGSFEGDSWYFRLVDGKPSFGPLRSTSLENTRARVELRRQLLKLTWDLCDETDEDTVKKVLNELEDKLKKANGQKPNEENETVGLN